MTGYQRKLRATLRARLLARELPLWTERYQLTLCDEWSPAFEVAPDVEVSLWAPRTIPHYVAAPVDAWLREHAA